MTHKPDYYHAGWLKFVLRTSELKETIKRCLPILQQYEFDAIAFRGMSGALISPSLATHLDKSMIMVRKYGEIFSHSSREVEGDSAAKTYIIVDDFVSSGDTIKSIISEIKKFAPHARCLGILEVNYIMDPSDEFREHPFIFRSRDDVTKIDLSLLGV